MTKYFVIDMHTLNFVKYIESNLSEDDINDMDFLEKEDTFNLEDGEMVFSSESLREQLDKLQELLDKEKE